MDENQDLSMNLAEILFAIMRPLAPCLFVASCLFLLAAIFLIPSREKTSPDPAVEETEVVDPVVGTPVSRYTAEELAGPIRLREALVEARGGRVLLSSIRSLRASGQMEVNGAVKSISILEMAPDLVLIQMFGDSEQVSMGYDGNDFWKSLRRNEGVSESMAVDAWDETLMSALGGIHGPLLREFLNGQRRVSSVEEVSTTIGPVLRVEFSPIGDGRSEVVDLDPSDLRLLRWEYENAEGIVVEMRYSDPQEVDGLVLAHRVEVWMSGERELVLLYDGIDLNFGAVKYLFRNPNL